jgi:hypothetical protein
MSPAGKVENVTPPLLVYRAVAVAYDLRVGLNLVVEHPDEVRDQLVRYLGDGDGLRRDELRD